MGYEEPSHVQAETIPLLLTGRDLIVQSLTGTGKTAAYGIPMVERLDPKRFEPQALVLAPTRELAVQVSGELNRIGRFRELCVLPIYGGQPIDRQLRSLNRGVHAIVATPGRLLDHIHRRSVKLAGITYVILDEADEMLNMGFLEDVELILEELTAERQTGLFSATIPDQVAELADAYLKDPVRITLTPPDAAMTVPTIEQLYYEVPRRHKQEALARLLDIKQPELALVFCATKRMVDELVENLIARGYRAEGLHGDMSQAARDKAIKATRTGRIEVLVATDVAARGLDIENISHVINYDLPQDCESYVHRIGRTARAGRSGQALTLVAPWEAREIRSIERGTGANIQRSEIPSVAELEEREREMLAERVLQALREGRWGLYRELVEDLASEHEAVDLAAAALALAAGPPRSRQEIPREERGPRSGQGPGRGPGPRPGGRDGRREGGPPRGGGRGARPWYPPGPPRGPGGQGGPGGFGNRGGGGRRRPPRGRDE
ncbi:MAG: DEAD/DEAH box helicase [Chloroflexi bacterium]|nr:DEAD/DEAH box helicase [Chloroflexota bacterium]